MSSCVLPPQWTPLKSKRKFTSDHTGTAVACCRPPRVFPRTQRGSPPPRPLPQAPPEAPEGREGARAPSGQLPQGCCLHPVRAWLPLRIRHALAPAPLPACSRESLGRRSAQARAQFRDQGPGLHLLPTPLCLHRNPATCARHSQHSALLHDRELEQWFGCAPFCACARAACSAYSIIPLVWKRSDPIAESQCRREESAILE